MKPIQYEIVYRTELDHWWYRVRRELVRKLIRTYAGDRGDLKILDIGCGTGALMVELETFGEVDGVDVSETAVEFCRARGLTRVRRGSITALPYPDGIFDVALALDVIEHVEDDQAGISEIRRVLKPGGMAIIFSPAFGFLWGVTDELSEHHRRYTLAELKRKIAAAGFKIEFSSYFNFFLFLPILLVRWLVRFFHIRLRSENEIGSPVTNELLGRVFSIERLLLPRLHFPFGVSVLAVCRK